jgi:hypothetical protein
MRQGSIQLNRSKSQRAGAITATAPTRFFWRRTEADTRCNDRPCGGGGGLFLGGLEILTVQRTRHRWRDQDWIPERGANGSPTPQRSSCYCYHSSIVAFVSSSAHWQTLFLLHLSQDLQFPHAVALPCLMLWHCGETTPDVSYSWAQRLRLLMIAGHAVWPSVRRRDYDDTTSWTATKEARHRQHGLSTVAPHA